MMFADCEGCTNCTENLDGTYTCERYGSEISRIHYCEDTNKEEE